MLLNLGLFLSLQKSITLNEPDTSPHCPPQPRTILTNCRALGSFKQAGDSFPSVLVEQDKVLIIFSYKSEKCNLVQGYFQVGV